MEITILGTSAMVPTKERNQSAFLISYGTENVLIDCGEGTQRQLTMAGISAQKITKILISHWHGDHTLGLPGLIQTLNASGYDKQLEIFGPKGTKKYLKKILSSFSWTCRISIKIVDIRKKRFYSAEDFFIEALPLEHGIPCLGFAFVEKDKRRIDVEKAKKFHIPEGPLLGMLSAGKPITFDGKKILPKDITHIIKGKKIAYVMDTKLCNNAFILAKDADLLISESTYATDLNEKAEQYMHMTAKDAAFLANQSNAKRLVLAHFSQRYKDTCEIRENVKDFFSNAECGHDFMKIRL